MSAGPASAEAVSRWVDADKGTVSREIFVAPEVYERELEQVFARAWLLIGHESQIRKPGDYFVSRMGEESVIMTRDRQGEVHVFLNSCMHRGMKVCRYDEGNTPVFTCPYHGWLYALDGSLVGVPYFKEAYHSELKKEEWGLREVAQTAKYHGWVWATWDKDAPDFDDYLGDMRVYFDLMTDHPDGSPGGQATWVGVQKWTMPANWKFAAENFIGDFYHNVSHRSVDVVGISPSGRKGRHLDDTSAIPRVSVNYADPSRGHGAVVFLTSGDLPYNPSYSLAPPNVEAYFEKAYYARQERLGVKSRAQPTVGTVFPNASISAGRSIAVWHPNGANSTEAWRFYFHPRGRAARGCGHPAPLRRALRGPVRDDGAGRYGELELRDVGQRRGGRPAPSLQLCHGLGPRDPPAAGGLDGGGAVLLWHKRAEPAGDVRALGPIHGSSELGRPCRRELRL